MTLVEKRPYWVVYDDKGYVVIMTRNREIALGVIYNLTNAN
jgi:hypothetical protein